MTLRRHFSQEQIDRAAKADIPLFLAKQGYELKRAGHQYTWQQPGESPVSIDGNKWYSHYDKVGGDAISFLQKFFEYDFRKAVNILIGEMPEPVVEKMVTENTDPNAVPKKLKLPPKAENNNRVFAYLTKRRLIAPEIVRHFIAAGALYESRESFQDKVIHNLVIVGKDKTGEPRQAHIKGITGNGKFRRNAAGSDSRFGFAHIGKSHRIIVFEAAVDLMSYLTLFPENWQKDSYVALDGTAEHALMQILDDYSKIMQVTLALDHDQGGLKGALRLAGLLMDRGLQVSYELPSTAKDWNELLRQKNGQDFEVCKPDPILDEVRNQAEQLYAQLSMENSMREPAAQLGWNLKKLDEYGCSEELLQTISLCAAERAKELLRPTGQKMDKVRFMTRICAPCCEITQNTKEESLIRGMKQAAGQLLAQEEKKNALTTNQVMKKAEEYVTLAGKALALHTFSQQMKQEAGACRMSMC